MIIRYCYLIIIVYTVFVHSPIASAIDFQVGSSVRRTSSAQRYHPRLPRGARAMRRGQRRREEHGGRDGGLTGGDDVDDGWSGSLGKKW